MSHPIERPLATAAVVIVLVLSVTVAAGGVAADTSNESDDEYVVIQDGEAIPIEPIGHGYETTEEFYDYRTPDTEPSAYSYSSHGTTHLQEDDTSILFLHESADGLSLVIVHDRYDGTTEGGAATFQINDLPDEGEWVVEDDNYSGGHEIWDHRETSSRISWAWTEARTDGAAFHGGLDDEFAIEIYPQFNERATLSEIYDGEVTDWQVVSGPEHDLNRTSLDMDQPITIASGPATSITVTDLTVPNTAVANDSVEIDAAVENDGLLEESFNVAFEIDGEPVDTQDVTLEPGESTTVSTTVEMDEAGTYDVSVSNVTDTVTVEAEEDDSDDEDVDGDDELVGFGVVAAAFALVLVGLALRYRS